MEILSGGSGGGGRTGPNAPNYTAGGSGGTYGNDGGTNFPITNRSVVAVVVPVVLVTHASIWTWWYRSPVLNRR